MVRARHVRRVRHRREAHNETIARRDTQPRRIEAQRPRAKPRRAPDASSRAMERGVTDLRADLERGIAICATLTHHARSRQQPRNARDGMSIATLARHNATVSATRVTLATRNARSRRIKSQRNSRNATPTQRSASARTIATSIRTRSRAMEHGATDLRAHLEQGIAIRAILAHHDARNAMPSRATATQGAA